MATVAGAQTRGASRWERLRGGLTRSEWITVGGMAAVVLGLTALGFFLLFAVVVPTTSSSATRVCSASGSGSPRTRSACATPSTPITSARSTTPRAS